MATTTSIHASVKISPQIRGTYYSIEYAEERTVQDGEDVRTERKKLFDDCYNEVVEQIQEIQNG